MATQSERRYLPAAGQDWLLPLYDLITKLLGAEQARKLLLDQAQLRSDLRVLDIGCGTGTLSLFLKRQFPGMEVVGLDPDPRALARARRKAERAEVPIRFDEGFSDDLPYRDASLDRVFSCFMFHHLPADKREKSLCEIRRVLAPGGLFCMLDFERPEKEDGLLARRLVGNHLHDNSEGRILTLMRQAGFASSKRVMVRSMLLGFLRAGYYQAWC